LQRAFVGGWYQYGTPEGGSVSLRSLFSQFRRSATGQAFLSPPADLTEPNRFEMKCRSESLLDEAERMASLASWELNLETGELFASPNLCRLAGIDPARTILSNDLYWKLIHQDDRETVRQIIGWAMKDLQPYEYQARFNLPDGRQHTFLVHGKPVLDSQNHIIKWIGVTQDITERIEAERALLESEERYRDLVENSNDLICTHDLRGILLSMNELPARILGYTPQEMIGRTLQSYLDSSVRHLFDAYLVQIARDGYARGLMILNTRSGEQCLWEYENTLRTHGVHSPIVRGMAHDVTELVHTQRALRLSESRLKALVNSLNEVVYELDAEGVILNVGTAKPANLPRPLQDLLGTKFADLKGTEFSRIFTDVLRRVLETGRGEEFEYLLNTSGGERWHQASVTIIPPVHDSKSAVCVLDRDITEKKQAEVALRKQEALLAQAERLANLGSWEGNFKYGWARWSDNLFGILGLVPNSAPVNLESAYQYIHPDDQARVRTDVEGAVRENREYESVTRHLLPDGRIRFLHSRGILVKDEKGEVVGLIGASQDITEQRQAQLALQESERLARLRLAELDQIYKTAPVGLCFVDTNLRYVRINEVLAAMNGRPASDHIGRTIREVIPDMANEIEALYRRVFDSGEPLIAVELQRPGNAAIRPGRCADVSLYPLKNESGSILGFNVVVQDITARKQAENTLRSLSARLLHLQDEERRRIARELHESTAQDLAALRLCLGEIQRREHSLGRAAQEIIQQCLQISDKVIGEVRTLSYVLHPPFLEEAGLKMVVPWFAAGFSERSGIQVDLDLSEDLRPLPPGYETALFRIMQESLMNVHRHSGSYWASVRIVRDDRQVLMEIQDRGRGMSPDSRTGMSREAHPGVGISGMRERVKELGGTCVIESEPGQGVTVRVVLPLTPESISANFPRHDSADAQPPSTFASD
jgi:PAS domain S-box-containing protein